MRAHTETRATLALVIACFGISSTAFSGGGHGHAHADHGHNHGHAKKEAGPNGGRIITEVEPHLEFRVTDQRTVTITPLDEQRKPAALSGQSVTLIGGSRRSPTRLEFAKQDGVLVSDAALPDGNNLPAVLQIKTSPDAHVKIVKFYINLTPCSSCDYKEYACICEH